jgi:hypothetical protein
MANIPLVALVGIKVYFDILAFQRDRGWGGKDDLTLEETGIVSNAQSMDRPADVKNIT